MEDTWTANGNTNSCRTIAEYKRNGERECMIPLKPILFLRSINPNERKRNKLQA
jgi:hypothetical protein